MKLVQYYLPDKGARLGVLSRDDEIIDVTSDEAPNTLELLKLSYKTNLSIGVLLADIQEKVSDTTMYIPGMSKKERLKLEDLDVAPDENKPHFLMPITPPEVWGCGVTYKRSADMRDEDSEKDIYSRVYFSERPELFFKATASRCVGPNEPICIRRDSKLTSAEPELAFVLGKDGEIVGYTICNDVSAWDIERENPLYLPQSKIFYGCCAIGPVFVTPSEINEVYNLEITCDIIRNRETIYTGKTNSSQIDKKFGELVEFLCRDNPIPIGTVVSTGTGIMIPNEFALEDGDVVKISIDELGCLSNPVKRLGNDKRIAD